MREPQIFSFMLAKLTLISCAVLSGSGACAQFHWLNFGLFITNIVTSC